MNTSLILASSRLVWTAAVNRLWLVDGDRHLQLLHVGPHRLLVHVGSFYLTTQLEVLLAKDLRRMFGGMRTVSTIIPVIW